jgi:hypothetical protein
MNEPPVGGSTGCCHASSAAVDEAEAFLRAVPPGERPRPLIPALREMFGISSLEAVEAIRQSHTIRGRSL